MTEKTREAVRENDTTGQYHLDNVRDAFDDFSHATVDLLLRAVHTRLLELVGV